MIAAIAAKERRSQATIDIPGAYLNAKMDEIIIVLIDTETASILVELDRSYAEYVNSNGTIAVQLDKALYGCLQSGKLWYEFISKFLISIGFAKNSADACVFNRKGDTEKQMTICLHVYDILATGEIYDINKLLKELKRKFGEVTYNEGPILSYLGMTMDFSHDGSVAFNMEKFIINLFEEFPVTKTAVNPANKTTRVTL
jgi:hypothetical protein